MHDYLDQLSSGFWRDAVCVKTLEDLLKITPSNTCVGVVEDDPGRYYIWADNQWTHLHAPIFTCPHCGK